MGKGRPSKYYTHVEPFLAEIEEMATRMTEAQIADSLEVSYRAFCDMKTKYPQLSASLKKGRKTVVERGRSALIMKAEGFEHDERKKIYVKGKLVREEVTTKYYPPDAAAINMLLKNYDPENWADNPQMLKLKREELELQRKKLEQGMWD
jgi:predicted solute-binding protein